MHEELAHLHRKIDRLTELVTHMFDAQERAFRTLNAELDIMAGELDALEKDVAAETSVIDSAVTLLSGLKAALDAAIASGDMSRVAAVNATIEAKTAALAEAVSANTPAA